MENKQQLIAKLKPYWKAMKELQDIFLDELTELELQMERDLQIEGIEFIWCDGSVSGIGTIDNSLELIEWYELEDK